MIRISTKLRDVDRHYIHNLIVSGAGQLPDKEGKVADNATHKLVSEHGFIIGAVRIVRKEENK